jgi:hypothetical protein
MRVSVCRTMVSWMMVVLMPAALVAQDPPGAMVYCKGTVWVNGNSSPESSAILSGDLVQTAREAVATITASGASIIVQPETVLKFVTGNLSLEQGNISVASSTGIATSAGIATVTPAANTSTEYEVTSLNGVVDVLDHKGNLSVNCGKETVDLSDGMQVTSDASGHCKRKKAGGAYPPASGNLLSNPYWKYIAGAAAGGILIWLLWPHPQQPASAAVP